MALTSNYSNVTVGPERAFRIPAVNLGGLRSDIEALAKKAEKLGVEAPALIEVGDDIVPDVKVGDHRVFDEEHPAPVARFVLVLITGEAPRLNGWAFAAAIEHTEAGNLVSTIRGDEDLSLRTIDSTCDHCGTKRSRKNTYIVEHEDGTRKHVGRNCLRDFLGHKDPARIADWAEMIADLLGGAEDEDREYGGSGGERTAPVVDVVATAIACIDRFGWKPKSSYAPSPTSNDVANSLWGKRDERVDVSERDYAKADAALAWIAEVGESGDYIYNLRTVASMGEVGANRLGLLVSLPAAHARAMEIEIKRAAEKAALPDTTGSAHQGEVKERITRADVTIVRIIPLDGDYGTRYLTKMVDADGNAYTWFASSTPDAEQGETVEITGTVKAHGEYQGVAETTLLRVKMTNARIVAEAKVAKMVRKQDDEFFALCEEQRAVDNEAIKIHTAGRAALMEARAAAAEKGDEDEVARIDAVDEQRNAARREAYEARQAEHLAARQALRDEQEAANLKVLGVSAS